MPRQDRNIGACGERPAIRWGLFAAILVLGAALRLYGLADRSLWYDEASSYLASQNIRPIIRLFNCDYTNEPPLFILLTRSWYAALHGWFGFATGSAAGDFALRLLPCSAGIAGIALTYWAGRCILKNESIALLGAFLFAISPFQVFYAQELRAYSLHVALTTGALVFMAKALEENGPRGSLARRRWTQWAGLTLCLVAGLYNHFVTVWVIVAFNLYFVAALPWHYRRLKAWVFCNLAVIILSLPALRMALFVSGVFEQADQRWFPYPDLRIALITFKDFFMGYSPNRLAYTAMTAVAAGLTALGVWSLKKRLPVLLLLVTAAAGPVAVSMMYWRHVSFPYYTHRLMIASAVPLYLLAGAGMRGIRRRGFTAAAVILCAGLTVPALVDHYEGRIHPAFAHRIAVRKKIDNREAAHFIAQRFKEGDIIAHRCTFTMTPFRYYLESLNPTQAALCLTGEGRRGVWGGYPQKSAYVHAGLVPEYIEEFTTKPRRVWFVDSWWEHTETDFESRFQSGWLDAHAFRVLRQPFDGLSISLYVNDPELMRRTQRSQVADLGARTLPYYRLPQTPQTAALAEQCRQAFATALTGLRATTPDGFGIYLEEFSGPGPSEGATRSGSPFEIRIEEDGTFSFALTVSNDGSGGRRLEGRVLESVVALNTCDFTRENPESEAWRPAFQYDPGPPPGVFNSYAMTVHLGSGLPDGEAIHADLLLDAGEYAAYIRCVAAPDPVQWTRAEARFMIAPEQDGAFAGALRLISATDGAHPAAQGWQWLRVGSFPWEGGVGRLRVAARNVHQLPAAYFDLDRVLIVRGDTGGGDTPFQTHSFDVEVAPWERKRLEFSSSTDGYSSKRVDVEVLDPASKETRRVWFFVNTERDTG